jgi:hypothetical protein
MAFYQLKNKTLLIMLLLLTFVSQSMASSIMSYEMTAMKLDNTHTMSAMSHNMPMMDATADINDVNKNCCGQHCDCYTGGCASAALVGDILVQQVTVSAVTSFYIPTVFTYNQFPKSLYRPPITA